MSSSRRTLHSMKTIVALILLFLAFTFSVSPSYQHLTNGLSAPNLVSPVNNTTWTQSLYPPFQWQAVTGASSYTIQISRSSTNFSGSNLVKKAAVYNTYYMVDTALANCTSYYWRVRAEDSDAGSWSSIWKFTIQVAPSPPVLTSPVNGAILGTHRPTFIWEASSGATSYSIEIDGTTYSVSTTSFTPYTNLSLGSHTWRVRATTCGGGQASDWSPQRTFAIDLDDVALKRPENGSVVTSSTPTFEWYPVDGATKYKLEVREDTIYGQKMFEVEVTGTSFTPTAILNEGTYAWHVMSYRNGAWTGSWSSQPFTFTIQTGENLTAPQLIAPPNGSIVDFPVTLQWSSVSGAYSYTLEYSRDAGFSDATSVTLFDTDHTIMSPLEEGRWYWHVQAKSSQGYSSPWSYTWSFGVGLPIPQLQSPANGAFQGTSTVNFDWSDVTGLQIGGELYDLDHYELQYSTSSTFNIQNTITVDETGGLPLRDSRYGPLNLGDGTYYWRVKAVYIRYPDGIFRKGSWSTIYSFSISTGGVSIPSQVILVSPFNGAQDMPPTPIFQWQALENTSSYTLEVSTNTSFTGLVVEKSGLTSTSWGTASDWEANDPSQLEDGTYYWRVSSDLPNSTSAVWNFTVKKPTPEGAISLTVSVSDLNGDPVSGATITLTQDGSAAGSTSTDASGNAIIGDLESGTYSLEVTATGYTSYTESLNLSASITKSITLYRGAVIHGYVYYDNTQNPAANVAVRVYDSETQLQVVSDITDTNGYFAVDNVADDKTYYIVVENYEDQKKQGVVPVDAPTTANVLTVIIKTEGEIIGVVQGEEGSPLAGAKVTLRDAQGQFVNSDSTSNIGGFTFKAAPGRYYVEVTLFGYEGYRGDIFAVEYKEVEDLGLITLLSKTGDLVVTVQSEGGDPLDATGTVKDEAGNVIDSISVVAGTASVEVVVGTYSLEVYAEGYQTQVATNITIESGTTVSQDFVLTPATGSVKVYVADIEGIPLSEAEVFLDGASMGYTDEIGTLVIPDASPEGHFISVIKEGYFAQQDYQTVNPDETVILEVTMEKSQSIVPYILIVVAVAALGGAALVKYMKSKPPTISKIRTEELSYVMVCPYCRNRIEKDRIICPYCGANLDDTRIYDDDTRIY